jgi:hypothetical protein
MNEGLLLDREATFKWGKEEEEAELTIYEILVPTGVKP